MFVPLTLQGILLSKLTRYFVVIAVLFFICCIDRLTEIQTKLISSYVLKSLHKMRYITLHIIYIYVTMGSHSSIPTSSWNIFDHALIIISAITKVRGHSVNLHYSWAFKLYQAFHMQQTSWISWYSEHFVIFGDSKIIIGMWGILWVCKKSVRVCTIHYYLQNITSSKITNYMTFNR